jgi:hypothetical protein
MGFEELGRAPVEADALALIELALAVVGGDALLGAHVDEARQQKGSAGEYQSGDHVPCRGEERHCCRDPYRLCISAMSFISVSTAAIFSADEGWGRPKPRNDMVAACRGVVLV